MRLVQRESSSTIRSIAVVLSAVLIAFALGSALFLSLDKNPLEAYLAMARGGFGSGYGLSETLVKTVPLGLCALGIALAGKMGLWNIGAEGQLTMGAIAASWVVLFWKVPDAALLPLAAIAAATAGALWSTIASTLRAWLSTSEILSTLMLNYVAELFLQYLVYGPWKGPDRFPFTVYFPRTAWLSTLGTTRLHSGIVVVVILAVVLHVLLKRTRLGFEIHLTGDSSSASDYAGVPSKRNILLVLAMAGALAGLAGLFEVTGLQHRLQPSVSPGFGYTAIIVAWLARRHMLGCLLVAFLFGGLAVAADELQIVLHIPAGVVLVFQALLFVCVLGAEVFENYEIRWRNA